MIIRTLTAATLILTGFNLPALADSCQDDVAAIDKVLAAGELDTDIRAQADDMRNQAVQLCGAGNSEEGLAMTAEAKTLLKIE